MQNIKGKYRGSDGKGGLGGDVKSRRFVLLISVQIVNLDMNKRKLSRSLFNKLRQDRSFRIIIEVTKPAV